MWEEVRVPSWRSPYPFKYNHCQWQGFDCSTEIKCIVNYGSLTPIVCYASKLQLCALCLYFPWLIASYYYVTLFWSHKGLFMSPLMDWQIRTLFKWCKYSLSIIPSRILTCQYFSVKLNYISHYWLFVYVELYRIYYWI